MVCHSRQIFLVRDRHNNGSFDCECCGPLAEVCPHLTQSMLRLTDISRLCGVNVITEHTNNTDMEDNALSHTA